MANRPPADIAPKDFFESWLPAQLAAAGPRDLRPMTVRVELAGDSGGAWDLRSGPGGVAIAAAGAAGAAPADVTVHQSVADWRAVVAGEAGAPSLTPEQAAPTDLLFLDRAAQQIAGTIKGTIRFEVTGYNGRTWMATVKLGAQPAPAQPDATITVDAETYAGILARKIPAPQAYFQGKIKMGGDATLAMQLAMSMMQR